MLGEAHEQRKRGTDVVVGFVETHGRKETVGQIGDLEVLPQRDQVHHGAVLREFDLDAAIARHPQLMLVDELAHSNVPGSRHAKRWQDIDELLDAGIDVFTAVNIQHLESLNDVVAQVTGVVVKETVPDAFFESADQIELVDLPPEELQQRLKEGKVYVPERVNHALEGFFRKGNLIALRELALRRAADRVDADMQSYRVQAGVRGFWQTKERVIVCIAPNHLASRVVRAAARIGAASHAELIAVYVESDRQTNRPASDQEGARIAIELAQELGMETVLLHGHDIVAEVMRVATKRNASMIIVGKPIKPRWKELLFGSVVDELVRTSGEVDVHVITAQAEDAPKRNMVRFEDAKVSREGVIAAFVAPLAASGICQLMYGSFGLPNLVMVYLLGVAFVSNRYGRIESAIASIVSVVAFDVGFVPPRGSFAVSDSQYLFTFAVMLTVGLLISSLSHRLRSQLLASSDRERRTAALYSLSKHLAQSRGKREVSHAAANEIREVFDGDAAVYYNSSTGINCVAVSLTGFDRDNSEQGVGRWALEHDEPAGLGTDTLPGSCGLYLPLRGSGRGLGYVAFRPNSGVGLAPQQRHLLETFANGLGLALERAVLAKESNTARLQAETERVRSALLSSISHDLRTPLTAIAGAASTLQSGQGNVVELSSTIYEESVRLNRQIQNLLDMTSLQSGKISPNLEWQSVEDLVGIALARAKHALGARSVEVHIPPDLPLMKVDGVLIEKAIANLLENAGRYTLESDAVAISANLTESKLIISVSDSGPGLPEGDPAKLFELGHRTHAGGFGLGLALCRAVMELHGGNAIAMRNPNGGAIFQLIFPAPGPQPEVPVE